MISSAQKNYNERLDRRKQGVIKRIKLYGTFNLAPNSKAPKDMIAFIELKQERARCKP